MPMAVKRSAAFHHLADRCLIGTWRPSCGCEHDLTQYIEPTGEIEVVKLVGEQPMALPSGASCTAGIWYGLGGGLLAFIICGRSGRMLAGAWGRPASLYGSQFRPHRLGIAAADGALGLSTGLIWAGSAHGSQPLAISGASNQPGMP